MPYIIIIIRQSVGGRGFFGDDEEDSRGYTHPLSLLLYFMQFHGLFSAINYF